MSDNKDTKVSISDEKISDEFRIEFKESDDYTIRAASSVRGGIQMRGDFLLEFFTERYEDPDASVYSVNEQGDIGEHIRNESFDSALIREKQVGVMMSQANAFDTGIWMIANLLGDGVSESDVEELIVEEFTEEENRGD